MEPIKTHSDLKKLIKYLDEQGFGYLSDWELHQKKINHIFSEHNKLGITYDKSVLEKLYKLEDYEEVEKEAKNYFSKFNVDDKIKEYIRIFSIIEDDSCQTPWIEPSMKDVITWVAFKKKYNLKDEFGKSKNIYYYNLDKNYLKIRFPQYSSYDFKKLYEKIFDEQCAELNEKRVGIYQNIGKLEIKFFAKGGANIKGDLKKLKEYYAKELTNKIYSHTIVKYNGKVTIYKSEKED